MNPVTYTMLDLKGLDLASVKGQSYPGLYNSIYAAMNRCQEIILCNWFVADILIPPTYCLLEIDELNVISINNKVFIYSDDTIEIPDMGTTPRILELSITQNGEYVVPVDYDGFNPVEVNVPPYIPVISSLSITENGIYSVPEGIDGYNPVTVNVPVGVMVGVDTPSNDMGSDGDYYYQRKLKNENGYTANSINSSINNKCGYKFTANEDIQVCGIRLFCRSSTTGSLILADANGNILKSIINLVFSSGWNYFYFDEPYSLTQGSSYIVYGSVSNNVLSYQSINSAVFNSKITCLCGLYGTLPGIQDNSYIYGTDIIIIASQNVYEVYKQFIKLSGTWTEIT